MDKSGKNRSGNGVAIISICVTIIILLVVIVCVAYAKFCMQVNGSATANVAKVICNMNVVPCSANDNTIINPYCTVTLNNFNNPQDITQADVNYKVEVELDSNSTLEEMPAYYWLDSTGNRVPGINESQPLTGSFEKGNAVTEQYTIQFVNEGQNTTTENMKFILTAVQESND